MAALVDPLVLMMPDQIRVPRTHCELDPTVFSEPDVFAPERWLDGDQTANRHQYAFGIGGRMCVASHVASKALYTVFFHLIAHFQILPAEASADPFAAHPDSADPVKGLLTKENPIVEPRGRVVRFVPRHADVTRRMLSSGSFAP